jgi:MarR family transcriptional regulator, organic hydroperoxide resistance regulator
MISFTTVNRHRERRQTIDKTAPTTAVALLRAADFVRRSAAQMVEPHGVTLQQYNVLQILDDAGPDGLPTLEVAARLIEETPGVTRLMDRLEAKALIRRQRCPQDRRQHLCWLTGEGAALLGRLTPALLASLERTFRILDSQERQRLTALLNAVGGSRE